MKIIKFAHGHPFAELVVTLEGEASNFCGKRRCRDRCFGEGAYRIKEIEKCKRLPGIHRLYWQAKSKSISTISPLTIYQEET